VRPRGAAAGGRSLSASAVEVCIPGYEDEPPERMEKQRFTLALPGDYQADVLRLAKAADHRAAGPHSGNVFCQLFFVDPASQAPPLVGQAASWLLPIVGFSLFLQGLDVVARLRGLRRNMRAEVAAQFGKSRATRTMGLGRGNTGVLFEDVAGQDAAISVFRELIDMLQGDPRFMVAGASMPKGVLLEGPPGTGKTLLAKAVAGEAGVPFFSANGSEFVEMYVGVAASRVRDLFARARASAPSIIFIDEIDTIGRARTGSGDPGAKEREQGLLQLLVEMDGFDSNSKGRVLLIGATNRREVLDAALLRSGRFDRVQRMGLPNSRERYDVLCVHASGKIVPRGADSVTADFPDGDALLRTTALLTEGYSGADLANLLNEASILAVRRNIATVGMAEVSTAMEKLKVGLPRAPLVDGPHKRQLAHVWAARAAAQTVFPAVFPDVLQVSIAPRGTSVARLDSMPTSRAWPRAGAEALLGWQEHMDRLTVLLAGRACEAELYGEAAVSMLTAQDMGEATAVAASLVGVSGLYRRRGDRVPFHLHPLPEENADQWPGLVRDALDAGVADVMEEAYASSRVLVRSLRPAIDTLAAELLARETLYGAEVRTLVHDAPRVTLPALEVLARDARDFVSLPHGPGVATFARGVGTVSFSRAARAMWPPLPKPLQATPVMGLACFGEGVGRCGFALFHGWVHRAEEKR
jgi:cell division protease FtsH